jgi:hypothetical protein
MGFANFFTGKWNWTASAMGFAPQQFCWWKWKLHISRLDNWDVDLAWEIRITPRPSHFLAALTHN